MESERQLIEAGLKVEEAVVTGKRGTPKKVNQVNGRENFAFVYAKNCVDM